MHAAELCGMSAKVKAALQAWDERRGPWDVVYTLENQVEAQSRDADAEIHQVQPLTHMMNDIYIPRPHLKPRPTTKQRGDAEAAEDWDEEISELFEWAGMACLGSQR